MITVEVEFLPPFTKTLGERWFRIRETLSETATLENLLSLLSGKQQAFEDICKLVRAGGGSEIIVLINGQYPPNHLSTKLRDRDKITVLAIVAGG